MKKLEKRNDFGPLEKYRAANLNLIIGGSDDIDKIKVPTIPPNDEED